MPRIPPPGKRIQPGEKRNPKGSSAKARALKSIKCMTPTDLARVTSFLLDADVEKVKAKATDTTAPFMEMLTAKMLWECYRKGDVAIYRAIMDRVVGRPKESAAIEISGPNGGAIQTSADSMSAAEIAAELAQIRAREDKAERAQRSTVAPTDHEFNDAHLELAERFDRA